MSSTTTLSPAEAKVKCELKRSTRLGNLSKALHPCKGFSSLSFYVFEPELQPNQPTLAHKYTIIQYTQTSSKKRTTSDIPLWGHSLGKSANYTPSSSGPLVRRPAHNSVQLSLLRQRAVRTRAEGFQQPIEPGQRVKEDKMAMACRVEASAETG